MTAEGSTCAGVTPIFDGLLVEAGLSWPGLDTAAPDLDRRGAGPAHAAPATGDGPADRQGRPVGWFEPNTAAAARARQREHAWREPG